MAKNGEKKASLNIQAGTVIGTTYSQMVGVTVTDADVTFEFVYINPRVKTEGQVVARVTTPRMTAQELAKIIPDTLKQHDDKKRTV